jgi:GAF domain-containing protein
VFQKESELVNLNRKITTTLEPKVLYHTLLSECSSILAAEFAFLFLLEKGSELQVHYLNEGKFSEAKLGSGSVRSWSALRGENNFLSGAPDQKEFDIIENILKRDIRCWISAPIILQDKLAGSIELASPDPERLDDESKQVLFRISQQASLAINNSQLYVKLLDSIKEISEARKEVDRIRRGQFL